MIVTASPGAEGKEIGPVFFFQFDLSPDGKMLAVPATAWAGVSEPDRGLYLVDLASPDRKVTKVPIPADVKSQETPKTEKAAKD